MDVARASRRCSPTGTPTATVRPGVIPAAARDRLSAPAAATSPGRSARTRDGGREAVRAAAGPQFRRARGEVVGIPLRPAVARGRRQHVRRDRAGHGARRTRPGRRCGRRRTGRRGGSGRRQGLHPAGSIAYRTRPVSGSSARARASGGRRGSPRGCAAATPAPAQVGVGGAGEQPGVDVGGGDLLGDLDPVGQRRAVGSWPPARVADQGEDSCRRRARSKRYGPVESGCRSYAGRVSADPAPARSAGSRRAGRSRRTGASGGRPPSGRRAW